MAYFIAASPLVKIFLPEWQEAIQENPAIIYDEKPFEFIVPRGTGGIRVKYNTPMQVPPKLAKSENEIQSVLNWLTGGEDGMQCQETDQYGIVLFDPKIDLISLADQMVTDGNTDQAAQAGMLTRIKEARVKVRALSEERIKKQLRMNFRFLKDQWQKNEEMKLGKYPPSLSEAMAMIVLDKEVQGIEQKRQQLTKLTNDIMNRTQVVGG